MIKALLFDLGRVIIPFDFNRGYAGLEALCGIPAREIPVKLAATGLVPRFESGRIEPHDFVRQLSACLNFETSYEAFCEIWSSIFLPDVLIPEEMLEGLGARYPLVLLSNTNAIHFDMVLKNYPILRHFHSYVLSYKVGAMKPETPIYKAAIDAAGCPAHECFFTDDISAYVEAARGLGIDAVQFRSAAQIEKELQDRGVYWKP